ncbi:hypothetical protein WJX84_005094 [Apatococcus fuscideae]|uniref:Uncharacterized protein n=1 Tax=Apatococcus fuscideae TaxID=2026836 RepID=A0AAW1TH50_9CHLO
MEGNEPDSTGQLLTVQVVWQLNGGGRCILGVPLAHGITAAGRLWQFATNDSSHKIALGEQARQHGHRYWAAAAGWTLGAVVPDQLEPSSLHSLQSS